MYIEFPLDSYVTIMGHKNGMRDLKVKSTGGDITIGKLGIRIKSLELVIVPEEVHVTLACIIQLVDSNG